MRRGQASLDRVDGVSVYAMRTMRQGDEFHYPAQLSESLCSWATSLGHLRATVGSSVPRRPTYPQDIELAHSQGCLKMSCLAAKTSSTRLTGVV